MRDTNVTVVRVNVNVRVNLVQLRLGNKSVETVTGEGLLSAAIQCAGALENENFQYA